LIDKTIADYSPVKLIKICRLDESLRAQSNKKRSGKSQGRIVFRPKPLTDLQIEKPIIGETDYEKSIFDNDDINVCRDGGYHRYCRRSIRQTGKNPVARTRPL
jgi:hypothetical protein